MLHNSTYNPDILTCLANLSNDEVFTPPSVVNQMLDMLPAELFRSSTTTFLDPVSKSGVFLREIAKRLMAGLAEEIPDKQERANHIFTRQLFGLSITELTALISRRSVYCSKRADGRYSLCTAFKDEQGNIRYRPMEHTFMGGKCRYCGAAENVFGKNVRGDLESHAYEFIHTDNPEKLFPKMKFDVIIGNPPYQLSDGGFGISATPIYHKFIEQAKKLSPRYLSMIVPARWFAGGKGLDSFRDSMLHDRRLRIIHDYPQAFECFPGVQIKGGVCYFLWDRDNESDCEITTHKNNEISTSATRPLLEQGCDTFIRYNEAIGILHKIQTFKEKTIFDKVSSRQPFGLSTIFHGREQGAIKLYENQGVSYIEMEDISKNSDIVTQYKIFIPRASSGSDAFPHPILGKPFVGEKNSACSETYMFIGPFNSKEECESIVSYIKTRFFRFLVMLKKVTQDTTKAVYSFVPLQDFSHPWTDAMLYEKYGLSEDEIAFIESMIRPME
ncbi:MAG: Eco57I restriction-modification methylase domain-containing protein [Bacteroidales bacterium]|nr:Eco57I restriction-modification methylase domain-containing protein [Candidatus Equimonas faecalis]